MGAQYQYLYSCITAQMDGVSLMNAKKCYFSTFLLHPYQGYLGMIPFIVFLS